jgi:DNA-directed RNA polymerase specialized sigma24 family protein
MQETSQRPNRSWRWKIRHPPSAIRNWDGLPSDVRIIGELLAEGYKPHDIAVLLQIPVSAVQARQRRLRRLDRGKLRQSAIRNLQ